MNGNIVNSSIDSVYKPVCYFTRTLTWVDVKTKTFTALIYLFMFISNL